MSGLVWSGSALALSGLVFSKLKGYIKADGEFLPIDINGIPHYIFNFLQSGKEDTEKALTSYIDGKAVGIERL
ncbi:MAG: hypothetical protein ACI93R_003907 [Flavobacteriales bacterium]